MREIAPGIWHWTARHERIEIDVSSHYLSEERVLIDPMLPPEGLGWFEQHDPPAHLVMSNRHHDRHAWRLQEAFGCTVHCVRNGLHEIEGRGEVEPFDFGDELPGGIAVHEIGAICPDEAALHIPRHGALVCADGVIRYGEELTFVPDQFMDDPEDTKRRLRDAYRPLLDLDFDLLLLAHGNPLPQGGKDALRAFVGSRD
jgi:glyoxylase-like metal-dependent hydrolase (beta-lactamase superfamily II)